MAGDYLYGKISDRWSATAAAAASGGTTATQAAPSDTNKKHVVTSIQTSGDAAALVTVESPANTVLYRKRFAAAFNMSETWPPGVLAGATGQAVLVKVDASTSNVEANIQGFTI